MIDITVRTLHSQNYNFSVEDDLTVLQFKEHISGTINVPADTQRIIFCGRVLADDAKLVDLDLHRKVVHLVERPPPTENAAAGETGSSAPEAPPTQGRTGGFTSMGGGSTMYVGSMAIPFEPTNFATPPPSTRLAGSRLNVAKRMLRRAEATIASLENPCTRSARPPPADDVGVEMTSVYEARVVVPADANDQSAQTSMPDGPPAGTSASSDATPEQVTERSTATITAEVSAESTPMSTSNEDLSGGQDASGTESPSASTQGPQDGQETQHPQASPAQERSVSRTTEMVELMDQLTSLQARFAPFLERYREFMRNDPTLQAEDARRTDRMLNRVSEVLHYFGHAYHSLSDIMVRARSPPPRRLACRPILIQQTAVVPAGFPIQVEAQINFQAEAPNGTATQPPNSDAPPPPPPPPPTTNSTPTNTTTSANNAFNATRFPFMNISGLPPGAVHVQSIPIGIRARPTTAHRPSAPTPEQAQANQASSGNQDANAANANGPVFGNPNVEFFMEVTPESITIDSLEATVLGGGARPDGTTRPNTTAPPAEFIQSFMQMAGLMNHGAATTVRPPATTTDAPASTTTSQAAQGNNAHPGQNSQARGNTQTNPTTATRTRSTARPHVHFSQHAIQGFDPFLPCNSHHVLNLRRRTTRPPESNAMPQRNGSQGGNAANAGADNPVYNLVQSVLSSLQTMYDGERRPTSAPAAGASGRGSSDVLNPRLRGPNVYTALPSHPIPGLQMPSAAALTAILHHGTVQTQTRGILADLFAFIGQHFNVGELLNNNGRIDPLLRLRNEIRTFTNDRVLEGNPATPTNVLRAVNNLIVEFEPFLGIMKHLPLRDNVDIVRSIELLIRMRLPFVINTAASRRSTAIRSMVNQVILLYRHLCALIMYASTDARQGIMEAFLHMGSSYLQGLPPNVIAWAGNTIAQHVRSSLRNINIPDNTLQPYIIRKLRMVDEAEGSSEELGEWESTEVEGESSSTTDETPTEECILGEVDTQETEQLPAMQIEPEQWQEDMPTDWVPIIARDVQRQRRQSPAPLSDAYLSGMPNKRRKVVKNNKPIGSIEQVISDGIRRAVNTSGLSTTANVDTVAQEAGSDLNVQSAYRDLLRTNVQSSLQDNEDFTPERYPNATAYFKKP